MAEVWGMHGLVQCAKRDCRRVTCLWYVQHFEGYDPEGFSMWMCDYKYNDENTVNYVVMNKVRSAG